MLKVQIKNHTLVSAKHTMRKRKASNAQWGKRKRQTHNGERESAKRTTHNGEKESAKRTTHNGEKGSTKRTMGKKKAPNAQWGKRKCKTHNEKQKLQTLHSKLQCLKKFNSSSHTRAPPSHTLLCYLDPY